MEPERVVDSTCTTGENPLWHPDEAVLYWCDIPNGDLYRFDPDTGTHAVVYDIDRAIGGFTIQTDGSLLLFESEGRVERWADGTVERVVESIPAEADSRFNDVIADPQGRVFGGTMPTADRLGRLYRIDTDGSPQVVHDGLDIPNGLAFTRDHETMYVTESDAHTIHRFDYDEATGHLTNREPFLETPEALGVPDGMTIDASGGVWSARWNGNALVRYTSDGTETERIEFPTRKVASVTFGGADYRDIYVTTAGGDDRASEGEGAGALYRLRADVQGREEHRSAIDT